MGIKFIIALFISLMPFIVKADPMVADLSRHEIEIDSSFLGTDILLFGATSEPGDIYVIVRGEEKNYLIRKKERVGGVWLNTEQDTFKDVPSFYAAASSNMNEADNEIIKSLEFGAEYLRGIAENESEEFREAFLSRKMISGVYTRDVDKISFMGETLFRTVLSFPENTPRGNYSIDVYLITNNTLQSFQTIPLLVKKTGMDALIFDFATHSPLMYGLLAIAIAVGAGWIAGEMARKI